MFSDNTFLPWKKKMQSALVHFVWFKLVAAFAVAKLVSYILFYKRFARYSLIKLHIKICIQGIR